MQWMKRNNLWLTILALLLLASCSSDDDPAGPSGDTAPEFPGSDLNVTVPAAMSQSTNQYAMMANSFIAMANAVSAHVGYLAPPSTRDENGGPPWEYTWEINQPPMVMTWTLIVDEDTENYTWDVYIDGTDGVEVLENYHYYHAEESKSTGCGSFTFFDYESDDTMMWSWCTDEFDIFEFTMLITEGSEQDQMIITSESSGAGTLDVMNSSIVRDDWCMEWHFDWNAAGDGNWISYVDCVVDDSGSWSSGNGVEPPQFPAGDLNISVPTGMAQSGDPYAIMAHSYIMLANGLSAHAGYLIPPEGAQRVEGPPWEYSWEINEGSMSMTWTLVIDEDAENYFWDVYIDGTDGEQVMEDYHFYHAVESKSTGCGSFTFFDYASDDTFMWSWCTDEFDVFSFIVTMTEGAEQEQIDISSMPSGAGSMDLMSSGVGRDTWCMEYHFDWDAAGNGSWIRYTDCVESDSGFWDAEM
jgi:hypothetical protein